MRIIYRFRILIVMMIIGMGNELISQNQYSEYGGCFTPRKELKVLMVCVRFNNWQVNPNDLVWPASAPLPTWANDDYLFDDLSDFNNIDPNNTSISRYYYEMTKNLPPNEQFKLYGDIVDLSIDLPDTPS